jgi:hypothetical protein
MEDLSNMTPAIVIGKLVAYDMSRKMGQEEATSSSKGIALTCDVHGILSSVVRAPLGDGGRDYGQEEAS